jgi:hypothetical protein
MNSEERNQLREISRRPLGSVWSYWPFVLPVLLVIVGVGVQIALLSYFRHHFGDFDIVVRKGNKTESLWDNQLVKEAVLTVSLSITVNFALVALLAWRAYKQAALLRAVARELGIDSPQPKQTVHPNERGNE